MRTARNEAGARFPDFRLGARDAKGILVKIINLTCPGCGARLEVDMDRKPAGPSRAPEEAQNVAVGSGVDLHFPRSAHNYHAEQGRHEQKG